MKLALCQQMRLLDETAISKHRIPGIVLMENAAISIFNECKKLKAYAYKQVVIFCGNGNNGGDGFALARHMHNDGAAVSVILAGNPEKISGDAKINYEICSLLGIEILTADRIDSIKSKIYACQIIIDALLGTGVSDKLRIDVENAVSLINESGKHVVSIDCPTGGNPDNGHVLGVCVRADLTVSLGLLKPGLLLYPLAEHVGKLVVGSIGLETVFKNFESGLFALDRYSAAEILPKRPERSHKGTFGKAVIVAGSRNMTGAAYISAQSAYRTGCGYVNICSPKGIISTLAQLTPQAVTTSLSEKDGFLYEDSVLEALNVINMGTVCLLGPGLGYNEDTAYFVCEIVKGAKVPLIIDADALNVLSDQPEILSIAAYPPIITPHLLEMSRLSGIPVKCIKMDVMKTAREFSEKYNCVTVLKDATTVITDTDTTYINKGACSAMAKAGSGDVLAGIITALVSQGLNGVKAGALGAFIHSQSGVFAAHNYGNYSVNSDDIVNHIHIVLSDLETV